MAKRCIIPIRLFPALGVIALWLIALFCDLFTGAVDLFGARCASLAETLFWPVCIFTLLSSLLPLRAAAPLAWRGVFLRLTLAGAVAWIATVFRPYPLISYKFFSNINTLRLFRPEQFVAEMSPRLEESLPRGASELRSLPEDCIDYLSVFSPGSDSLDAWGHPWMLVVEDRKDGLWAGLYSKGADGVSATKGNDPDDQNSWGNDGWDHYRGIIRHRRRKEDSIFAGTAFLFLAPICLLISREPRVVFVPAEV